MSVVKYRTDVDGLRAIAVLAVVIFHAFPSLLPGGYIGVDIFFVVSGYLITKIISLGLLDGRFSFLDFYAKRINRIFPALIIVLTACLAFGWFTLVADEYAQLGRHLFGGAVFISNLLLWSESGYFDTSSSAKPLLHLWSLGVEEQFYIVWPALAWLAVRFHFPLRCVILMLLVTSFAVNMQDVISNSAAAYYSPVGRFWELLLGGFLANCQLSGKLSSRFPSANIRAMSGLIALSLPALMLSKSSPFPGWWALLPTIGTALILEAGNKAWVNRILLSNRALVQIGLISYPLYLWHWPILSFAEILIGKTPSDICKLLCILIAVILAWLTSLVVEKPFKNRPVQLWKILSLTGAITLIGLLGLNIFNRDGLPFRHEQFSSVKDAKSKSAAFSSLGVSLQKETRNFSCGELAKQKIEKIDQFCHLTSSSPHIAVIGDSHANHLLWGLKSSSDSRVNRALVIGAGGCHPTIHGGQSKGCDEQGLANIEAIESFHTIRTVVIAANASSIQASSDLQLAELQNGYLMAIARLQKSNFSIIFIRDTPEFLNSPVRCALNPLPLRNKFLNSSQECAEASIENTKPRDKYEKFLWDLRRKNNSVIIVDAYLRFCQPNLCDVVVDGSLIYKDTNHLTDYGSKLLVDELEKSVL